jgi:hypothetical protein
VSGEQQLDEDATCDQRPHPHELVSIMIVDNDGRTQTWRDICAHTLPNLDRLFAQPDMVQYGLSYTRIPREEVAPGQNVWVAVGLDGSCPPRRP